MQNYRCPISDTLYDPAVGDPTAAIPPGTAFADLPDTWSCPDCGVAKADFSPVDDAIEPQPVLSQRQRIAPKLPLTDDETTVLRKAVALCQSRPDGIFDAMADLYPGFPDWDRGRFANAVLDLLADGCLNVETIGTQAMFVTDTGLQWVAENGSN